ncbi:hypothetical protein [Amorphus sp. 3PC139-8]|uniref:hypothetical protein n=1 Tax=Amorphus sp. 3PC139-8 TaxID=2735676 RepID=UPI00345DA3EC
MAPGVAEADISIPECGPLAEWAEEGPKSDLDIAIGGQSSRPRRVILPGAFRTSEAATLFGSTGESWTKQEMRQLENALRRCAHAAEDADQAAALAAAREWAKQGQDYLGASAAALKRVPGALETIAAQPFSLPILVFLETLSQEHTAETFTKLRGMLRDLPPPLRAGGLVELNILNSWGHLPPDALEERFAPEVARQLDVRRAELAAILLAEIETLKTGPSARPDPATMRKLDELAKAPLLDLLDPTRREQIEAAIAEQKEGMATAAASEVDQWLEAVQPGTGGLMMLMDLHSSHAFRSLSREEQAEVRQRIQALYPDVIRGASAERIERIKTAPEGPKGLNRSLLDYDRQTSLLADHGMEAELKDFKAATIPLLEERAEAVLQTYYLPALQTAPVDEKTLPGLARERYRVRDWPEPLAPYAQQYIDAVEARLAEIESALAAAEAGPLVGRTYRLASGNTLIEKLEFIDDSRVLVSLSTGLVQAGTYEELPGGRVILTSERSGNFVVERDGPRLDAGQFVFERVRE